MRSLFYFLLFLFNFLYFTNYAQTDTTKYWKKAFEAGINFNQANFSSNWKGGGVNSLALGTFINTRADYLKDKVSFNSNVQLQYGILKNAKEIAKKSVDRIFLDTKLGYKFAKRWSFYVALNFQSQFDLGYLYGKDSLGEKEIKIRISQFMAPGYLSEGIGVEYSPASYFWLRLGTGTLRQTFVVDKNIYLVQPQNYGVPVGKTMRNEVAFQLMANFDKDIAKNIHLKTLLTVFANYETLDAIDKRLDITLTAKITKFINVNLSGVVLYDKDMDAKVQYSQCLALGLLYSL